ncbi:MAG: universal stress protein [Candidatus Eisenbacteria bacterium]|uniref:Universal stress protein n=1 Tax=Eiseniibacteriota bacterium TaxID=2212470 RepID=A0A933W2R1_UNCEI|nr:universal stress protein [Candidatus Eisenbacteria bacterium]
MKILLALDTCATADQTVATVQRLFAPDMASVVALSVVGSNELDVAPSPVLLASVAQNIAVLEADHVRTHEECVARAVRTLRAAGYHTSGDVRHGEPRDVIPVAAREHQADLVVVGVHRRTSIRRLISRSLASHVTEHAHCDVLVVRHDG